MKMKEKNEENIDTIENILEDVSEFLSESSPVVEKEKEVDEEADDTKATEEVVDEENETAEDEEETAEEGAEDEQGEVEGVVKEEEGTEEEGGEEEDLTIEEMRRQINEMAKAMQAPASVKAEEKDEGKKEEKKEEAVKVEAAPVKDVEITQEEFDDALESPSGMAKLFKSKMEKIVEGRVQEVLRAIPNTINSVVDQRVELRIAASDFYRENPDLIPYKQYMGVVANEVFGKDPNLGYEEGFKKTGEEVRKRLKIRRDTSQKAGGGTKRKPAFVKGVKSRKAVPPKVEGLEAEIMEFISE